MFILLSLAGVILSTMLFGSWMLSNAGGTVKTYTPYQGGFGDFSYVTIGTMVWCWLAFYLGLVRLFLVCFAKNLANRFVLGIVLLLLSLFIGVTATLYISTWESNTNTPTFEWYSIANIFWSVAISNNLPPGALPTLILASALVVGANWLTLSRDLVIVKLAVPPRVREARTESKTLSNDD